MINEITTNQRIKVIPRQKVEERSRAEHTLLYELIQRNPEKAREFLRRLGESVKTAA